MTKLLLSKSLWYSLCRAITLAWPYIKGRDHAREKRKWRNGANSVLVQWHLEVLSQCNYSGGSSGNAVYMQCKSSVHCFITALLYQQREKASSGDTVINQCLNSAFAVVKWYVRNI